VSSLEILRGDAEIGQPASVGVIDTAFAHVRTLTRLLDDLLDVSRISRKKFKLNREVIELQAVVNQSLQIVEAFYTSRKQNLTISMPQTPIWLEADPLRFQQIIVNILYNAAKYTEANGRIAFRVAFEGKNELRISVKDNGIGIAPNMISRIFDPFVQAYAPGAGSGLGIGLALTKRLVELHGGKVWAESEGIGKGSTFTVVLPLPTHLQLSIPIEEKRGRKATVFGKKKHSQSRNILVVDDNEAAATALGTLLTRIGHTVAVCLDGETAIQKVREERQNVVVLDIGMPGMDGYEVAKRLRHEHGDESLILIAVTGFGQEEDKKKAEKSGFNFHLTKPVSIADLSAVLK
jgi:CheY-like chemotaxis protein